jgi:hypothetical protein
MDPDFMWRSDIEELLEHCRQSPDKALHCVKHNHKPDEAVKMDGVSQGIYHRKNWSSLYVCKPWKCKPYMQPYHVNNMTGANLHAFTGFTDEEIGAIDESWNWLEGWSSTEINPDAVHFTRGTPDMIGSCAYDKEWWGYAK